MAIFKLNLTENLAINSSFDLQGHRGCRGLMPENTIPAFLHALALGVTTLEMDVVITRDLQVVVSHEPYLNHEICDLFEGKKITAENEQEFNIFQMDYTQLSSCDCGSKPHPRFPLQKKMFATKPLLSQVLEAVKSYVAEHATLPCFYNIEIKSTPAQDGTYHPPHRQYADLLLGVITQYEIMDYVTIQSFDPRPLQYLHEAFPKIKLSLLVENELSLEENIDKLSFTPDVYSPEYMLVAEDTVRKCKAMNMQLIPWTVNDTDDMQRMVALGVHGLITDYPDRFKLIANTF